MQYEVHHSFLQRVVAQRTNFNFIFILVEKVGNIGEKWWKIANSGQKLERMVESEEKWGKVANSESEQKWGKVGKSGESW